MGQCLGLTDEEDCIDIDNEDPLYGIMGLKDTQGRDAYKNFIQRVEKILEVPHSSKYKTRFDQEGGYDMIHVLYFFEFFFENCENPEKKPENKIITKVFNKYSRINEKEVITLDQLLNLIVDVNNMKFKTQKSLYIYNEPRFQTQEKQDDGGQIRKFAPIELTSQDIQAIEIHILQQNLNSQFIIEHTQSREFVQSDTEADTKVGDDKEEIVISDYKVVVKEANVEMVESVNLRDSQVQGKHHRKSNSTLKEPEKEEEKRKSMD